MQETVKKDIHLAKKTQAKKILVKMWKAGVGTNEVENAVKKLTKGVMVKSKEVRRIVKKILETKVKSAKNDEKEPRNIVRETRIEVMKEIEGRGVRREFYKVHQQGVSSN